MCRIFDPDMPARRDEHPIGESATEQANRHVTAMRRWLSEGRTGAVMPAVQEIGDVAGYPVAEEYEQLLVRELNSGR